MRPKKNEKTIEGLEEFKKHLDTVIVVPNQNFLKLLARQLPSKSR